MSLLCPRCGSPERHVVVDSRPEKNTVRRRRRCYECHERFTTYELSAFEFRRAQQWIKHVTEIKCLANDMLLDAGKIERMIERGARDQVLLRDMSPQESHESLPISSTDLS